MTPQETYGTYLGLSLHFKEENYDYTIYGPRKVSESALGKHFVLATHLSGKFQSREAFEHHLIGIFKHRDVFIKELFTPENTRLAGRHVADIREWRGNLQSDLECIVRDSGSVEKACKIENGLLVPPIGRLLLNGDIRVESFLCLDHLLGFNQHIGDLVWKTNKTRIKKYRSFFSPRPSDIARIVRPFFD